MTLIPYVELNGSRTIADSEIHKIYDVLVDEKLLDVLLPGGAIQTPAEFLAMMKNPGNLPVALYKDGAVAGIGWINGIGINYAFGHFCFFKASWGRMTVELGMKMLEYWFSFPGKDGPLFDVIIGVVPSWNTRALRFIQKLGFVRVGEIPKYGCPQGSTLSYKLRE